MIDPICKQCDSVAGCLANPVACPNLAISQSALVAQASPVCSEHPDAPHGFSRNASHSKHRYVCECEGWIPNDNANDNALDNMLAAIAQPKDKP